MTHFETKPFIFRGEIIGFIHVFDFDIEIQTNLLNEIVDYSGCGHKQAIKLINKTTKK